MSRRKWVVRVSSSGTRTDVTVFLSKRWFFHDAYYGLRVAELNLTAPDAEEQIAEARAKAGSLARSMTDLERGL